MHEDDAVIAWYQSTQGILDQTPHFVTWNDYLLIVLKLHFILISIYFDFKRKILHNKIKVTEEFSKTFSLLQKSKRENKLSSNFKIDLERGKKNTIFQGIR